MVATSSSRAMRPDGMSGALAEARLCGTLASAATHSRSRRGHAGTGFHRAEREAVEKAIRDKGVDVDLDALLSLDGEVRAAEDRDRSAAGRAQRDQRPVQGARARGAGRAWARGEGGGRARRASWRRAGREGRRAQGAADALPNIPWDGAPVGPDESFNTVVRHRRRGAEVRFRAARPCRADREERLGGPVAHRAGVGIAAHIA